MPDRPNLHRVRNTTRDDEDCEAQKYPFVLEIYASVNKIEKGAGDCKVR